MPPLRLAVEPKPAERLLPTPILQQTSLWGRVKSRLGWESAAFDILAGRDGAEGEAADLLLVTRPVAAGRHVAYAPLGPEYLPDEDARGPYLERLSEELRPFLPPGCAFIRYDLPWESPYARESSRYDEEGHWLGAPEPRVSEMRMNFGTEGGALRKALTDLMPPDTVLVGLEAEEGAILERMHHSTRRNIRLAERRGVEVLRGGLGDLDAWYELYEETAARDGFALHGREHFAAVLSAGGGDASGPAEPGGDGPAAREASIVLLMARRGGRPVAGLFLALSGTRATYLYGASAWEARDCRASYALQWAAIRLAKASGCLEYDLFGCAPRPDPEHPLYGLWRFKTGFGGELVHRQGCWDYPLDPGAYASWRARELSAAGFHR